MQLHWFGIKRNKRYTARNTAAARLRLCLEQLEKREVLSAFTPGDVVVDVVGPATSATISSIAESSATATVTTATPNSFSVGEAITISGTSINGYNTVPFATPVTISSVQSSTKFTFTATSGLGSSSGGTVTLALNSTATATTLDQFNTTTANQTPVATVTLPTGATTASITAASWATSVATITTSTPHGFGVGQLVEVSGVTPAGFNTNTGTSAAGFTITSVPTPTTFTYALTTNPVTVSTTGAMAVVGSSSPTITGAIWNGTAPITAASWSSGSGDVTVTASNNFVANETVTVSGINPSGYDGTFTILSAGSSTFTYAAANPGANTATLGSAPGLATVNEVTITAANSFSPGNSVAISGITPTGFDPSGSNTFTIASATSTTFTYPLASSPYVATAFGTASFAGSVSGASTSLTEGGSFDTEGYITDSADGQSLILTGYAQLQGLSTTNATRVVGVISPSGTVDTTTQFSNQIGSSAIHNAAGADSVGAMYVATSPNGIRYVPFGSAVVSDTVVGASWSSANGGTATIATPVGSASFTAGQIVAVAGITPSGYNGTETILSSTATSFTYALATNPGTTGLSFNSATVQLLPIEVTNLVPGPGATSGPTAVGIGTDPNGNPDQLFGAAGIQFNNVGIPSIDGPFSIGSGLPTTGGQPISVYGTGVGTNFPTPQDVYAGFPTTNQFIMSPDGQTVFVPDGRTDGLGGILEYYQLVPNDWQLKGQLQLDSFTIINAQELGSGSIATVTTSSPVDFTVGQTVSINGMSLPAYNDTSAVITSVNGDTFTYSPGFTGLASSGPGVYGANATGTDGGFRALTVDFSNPSAPVIYAITTGYTSAGYGNRLVKITGGTTDGSGASLVLNTVLATATQDTAFRGVALAPTAPGTTATTTTLTLSGPTAVYADGTTLSATVNQTDATGVVSFRNATTGAEITVAPLISGTATTAALTLSPGTYNIVAVYTGDSVFSGSTSSPAQVLTVTQNSSSSSLGFSPISVGTGQPEVLTDYVTVPPAGTTPTGTVTFTNGSVTIGTAPLTQVLVNVNGVANITFQASFTTTFASQGTDTITATYSGDTNFTGSFDTELLGVVNSTSTTVTSSITNPTASPSQSVIFTAQVTPTSGGGTPGGTIQFYDDLLPIGNAVTFSGGSASISVNTALVQQVSITNATEPTSSNTVTMTTNATLPYTVGQLVTIEGVVLGAVVSGGSLTGGFNGTFPVLGVSGNTFTYVDTNATGLGTDTLGGTAVGLNVLTPGLHSITAAYTPTGANLQLFAPSAGVHEQTVGSASFAATDIFEERNGDGISPLNTRPPQTISGSIGATVYVDEYTPAGALVQSVILPTADSPIYNIASAAETGSSVTITTTTPNDFLVGQSVTITGLTPSGFDGTFTITGATSTTFSYAAGTGLGSVSVPLGTTTITAQGVVHAVVGDGQQSPTGQMSLSGDGSELFITGYDNNALNFGTALPLPTVTGSASVPRSLARISFNGTVQTVAFSVGSTGINATTGLFNAVYSPDGNQYYVGASTGIYYFPSFVQTAALQGSSTTNLINSTATVGLESYGGNLYAVGGGGSSAFGVNIIEVGPLNSGMPTASTTATQLPGIPTTTSGLANPIFIPIDLYLTHTNGPGSALDTLYISDDGKSFGEGAITKWSLGSATIGIASATEGTGSTTATVTITTSSLSAFAVGQSVTISGITPSGYDGTFTITGATSTTFTYTDAANLGSDTVTGATVVATIWQEAAGVIPYSGTVQQLGFYYLAGITDPTTKAVTLYSNYGNGGNADFGPGFLYTVTDTSGYNASPSSTTTTTLVRVAAGPVDGPYAGNETFRGVALAPHTTPPAFTSNGSTTFTVGTSSSFTVTATGGPTPTYTETGPLPGGVTLNAATGVLSGNPTIGTGQVYNDTITATNVAGSATQAFALTVDQLPAFTSASFTTFTIGTSNTFTLAATGFPTPITFGDALSIEGGLPGGITFNAATGVFSGDATAGTARVYNDTITATNAAGSTTQAFALTVNLASTTTTLTDLGPNPSLAGGSAVTFTIAVTGGAASTDGETVLLEDASNSSIQVGPSGTLSSGSATIAVSGLSAGPHNIFAVFGGDTSNAASPSPSVLQTVLNSTTTTLIDNGPTPSLLNQGVSYTVNVSSSAAVGSETVALVDASAGNATIGMGTLTSGAVTISDTFTTVGTHNIFAVYGGDATHAPSQSVQVPQSVLNSTSTTLTDNGPNPSLSSASITFTAAVTGGAATDGETVLLEDASNSNATIGASTLSSGSASFTVSGLSAGPHNLIAVYGGDPSNAPSQSSSVMQTVLNGTTTTLTDNGPNPSLLNQGVSYTVNVSSSAMIGSETVALVEASSGGNTTVGMGTLTSGTVTISDTFTTAGSHSIFALYSGDATNAPSQSAQIVQTVNTITSFVAALPATETTNSFNVFWSGNDAATGSPTITYTIMVSDNFAPYTTFITTTATTAAFTGENGHTYSFFSLASDNLGNTQTTPTSTSSTSVRSVPVNTLVVTSFIPTPTGFTAMFSKPFLNTSNNPVHLYSANASNAAYGPADVTLVGRNTGLVTGSLVINSNNTGFTFIKTDLATGGGTAGLLAPDNYTVTFLSGSLAFQDVNGNLLDGNSSGVGGANYTNSFTVTAPAANTVTVSIPDFGRGPDANSADSINLVVSSPNPLSGGIPVAINIPAGDSVTSATVTLQYSTSQLTINSAFPNAALGSASFTSSTTTDGSGNATTVLTFNSLTALPTGSVVLGGLVAYVPAAAPYPSKQLLQMSSSVDGGTIPTINDDALQAVVFLGNTSGSGSYSSLDSGLLLNVSSGADAGFSDFPALDPAIVGDLNGSGIVDPGDAVQLNLRNSTDSNPAFVPAFPGAPSNTVSGPDPTLSIPSVLTVNADGTVLAPVNIDDPKPDGSTGLLVAQLALRYDPSLFTVTAADVSLGSIPQAGTGWLLQAVVDQTTGEIGITLASRTPIDSQESGSLAVVALQEKAPATAGQTALELVASATPNGRWFSTSLSDQQGPLTLTPAPSNSGPVVGQDGTLVLSNASTAAAVTDSSAASTALLAEVAVTSPAATTSPDAQAGLIGDWNASTYEVATADLGNEPGTWAVTSVSMLSTEVVPSAAITQTPVGLLETGREPNLVVTSSVALRDTAATSPIDGGAGRGLATLQPIMPVVPGLQLDVSPASGYGFTINAAPTLTGALQTVGTALPGFGVAMPQHAADQVFLNLSANDGNQIGRTLPSTGGALSGLAGASEATRQEMDSLLWDKAEMNALQPDSLTAETPVLTLDGYFAQLGETGPEDGE